MPPTCTQPSRVPLCSCQFADPIGKACRGRATGGGLAETRAEAGGRLCPGGFAAAPGGRLAAGPGPFAGGAGAGAAESAGPGRDGHDLRGHAARGPGCGAVRARIAEGPESAGSEAAFEWTAHPGNPATPAGMIPMSRIYHIVPRRVWEHAGAGPYRADSLA